MREDDALDPEVPEGNLQARFNASKNRSDSGRFGSGGLPMEPTVDRKPRVAIPVADPSGPTDSDGASSKHRVVFAVVAVVAVVILGIGAISMLGGSMLGGGDPDGESEPRSSLDGAPATFGTIDITGTSLTDGSGITGGTNVAATLPTVPPPPVDATVPEFPGRIVVETANISFRYGSTSERLRLVNDGGGEADWQVSVGAGSGLRLSATDGRLRPGETVEVEIGLDRASGPAVTDWAVNLLVIGGGNTSPGHIRVSVFPPA